MFADFFDPPEFENGKKQSSKRSASMNNVEDIEENIAEQNVKDGSAEPSEDESEDEIDLVKNAKSSKFALESDKVIYL